MQRDRRNGGENNGTFESVQAARSRSLLERGGDKRSPWRRPGTQRPPRSVVVARRLHRVSAGAAGVGHGDRVQSCELRNADRDGAGWDVFVRKNDEVLFSRRCVDERGARFVAESFKEDLRQDRPTIHLASRTALGTGVLLTLDGRWSNCRLR